MQFGKIRYSGFRGLRESGRPSLVTDPDGDRTAFDYDVRDWLLTETDGAGRVTRYGYTGSGDNYCIRGGMGTSDQRAMRRMAIGTLGRPVFYWPSRRDHDAD